MSKTKEFYHDQIEAGMRSWEDLFSHPERFMRYDGQFLYPPRIESKLQPVTLAKLDNGEYVGQPKFNGSNTSVTISETSVVAKERHNTFFAIPPKFDFKSLHRGNGYLCITGEFMNKSKKDQSGQPFRGFCIWDMVAYENKILIGSTPEERIALINYLYPSTSAISSEGIDYLYRTNTPDIYKGNNFHADFLRIYHVLSKIDMIEGFVLKRKNGKLEMMTREQNNTGWAVKVRKPTANYLYKDGGETDKMFRGGGVQALDLDFHSVVEATGWSAAYGLNKYFGTPEVDVEGGKPTFYVDWELQTEARSYGIRSIDVVVKSVKASIEWEVSLDEVTEEEKAKLISVGGREYRNNTMSGTIEVNSDEKLNGKEWNIDSSDFKIKDGQCLITDCEIDFQTMTITVS